MRESVQKWIFLILFIALALLLGRIIFSQKGIRGYLKLKKELTQTKAEIENLKAEKRKLELEITKLKTDPNYIEKIAREVYDLLRENEIMIKFADEDSDSSR